MIPFLKIFNPIISVIVLLLCIWAAGSSDYVFKASNLFKGEFTTYFIAKGLFCSASLFILGKILEKMVGKSKAN